MNKGIVTQIIGAVVDMRFDQGLPALFNAVETAVLGKKLVLEVQRHLGLNEVRTVAMSSTDGLSRGQEVIDMGEPISVPVGAATLGRLFDVTGNLIDGGPALAKGKSGAVKRYPIHRDAPAFVDQSVKAEILETGIKVIDLLCPFL